MRGPRHLRPQRERYHKAERHEGEEVRAAERLGGFGTLAARGGSPGLTDKGLRPRRNHARRRMVGPKHRLKVLAVFAT